jgi:hypothetical protein
MKRILRLLMLPLFAGLLLGGTTGTALAHVVYEGAWTYASSTNCTHNRAEVSHGTYGKGYMKVDVRSDYKVLDVDCVGDWTRPAGYIAIKWRYLKWTGSSWGVCQSQDYTYNSITTDKVIRVRDYQTQPCGAGYYMTDTNGYVYNGSWYGGYLHSGTYHYL